MCQPKQLWYISVFRTCWWKEYHEIETVVVQNILLCFIIRQRIKLLRHITEVLYPKLFNSKYIYTKTTMKLHVITYNKNAFKSNLPTLYILTLPTQIDFILIAAVLWYAHKKILIVQEIMAHTMKLMALDLNCIKENTFKKDYIIKIAK